jgi:hypothetical protein
MLAAACRACPAPASAVATPLSAQSPLPGVSRVVAELKQFPAGEHAPGSVWQNVNATGGSKVIAVGRDYHR